MYILFYTEIALLIPSLNVYMAITCTPFSLVHFAAVTAACAAIPSLVNLMVTQ